MGLLGKILCFGSEINKIADAHNAILRCYDNYEYCFDVSYLETAAWLIKAGIINKTVENKLRMDDTINVQYKGHLIETNMREVIKHTHGMMLVYMKSLSIEEFDKINEIMSGGKAFYDVEYTIPNSIRRKYGRL